VTTQITFPKPRHLPLTVFQRVIERDGYRCHWCGIMCDPKSHYDADNHPTRDHLMRRCEGGKTTMANIVVSCRKCNNTRHAPGWTPRGKMLK